jgi:hypothetical protein
MFFFSRRTVRGSEVAVTIPAGRLGCRFGRILITIMLGWMDYLALKLLQLFLDPHWRCGETAV